MFSPVPALHPTKMSRMSKVSGTNRMTVTGRNTIVTDSTAMPGIAVVRRGGRWGVI